MTSTNFVFPLPPPPPPPSSANSERFSSNQNHSGNAYNGSIHGGQYGGRGNSRARAWPSRGSRGGRGGGSSGHSNPKTNGQHLGTRGGYNSQQTTQVQHYSNGPGQYPQQQYQVQHLQQNGYGQRDYGFSNGSFVPSHGGTGSQNPYPSNNGIAQAGLVDHSITDASSFVKRYGSEHQDHNKHSLYNANPPLMGPPIRMGFQGAGRTDFTRPHGQAYSRGIHQSSTSIENISLIPQGPGQKRTNSAVFDGPRNTIPKPLAPPSVPEFGTAIDAAHHRSVERVQKSRKKRKHNQLGLTPKTEEHESSEDEEVDEESKLAAVQASDLPTNPGQLQFLYKGRLATLNSPSEIAAWIEERKKRYPTKKRVEEEARRREKSRQAERDAGELRRADFNREKAEKETKPHNSDKTAKAKQKAEKLRKQYEKAQRRVAEIEATNFTASSTDLEHKQSQNSLTLAAGILADTSRNYELGAAVDSKEASEPTVDILLKVVKTDQLPTFGAPPVGDSVTNPQFPGSEASLLVNIATLAPSDRSPKKNEANFLENDQFADARGVVDDSASLSSSEVSHGSEDDTSSSGSSSERDSPTEISSKRTNAANVLHAKTKKTKTICKLYLTKGYCPRGQNCHYLHELPKRGSRKPSNAVWSQINDIPCTGEVKKERVTLYQRMLAQQQEREDEMLLQYIIFLGEHHILDGRKLEDRIPILE
ncbi:hypothetical protein MMC18_000934 [Xylographa bjoerkii]|nr:hypothetical protein [Xylographa bjoerkii]